ncbi:carbohydrate-binding protein, partial [Flavobacteriales bacterium]|nr:carbohydrate-binding protein [Flavobacteriales bacterium]
MRKLLSPLFAVFIFCGSLQSQNRLATFGHAIVNEAQDTVLLRGMGLGGWMVQEGYMLQTSAYANPQWEIRQKIEETIGEEATEEFYDAWLHNHVQKSDIDSMKAWGFNSVRLPMHYNLFTLPIEEEPVPGENTWLEIGFELTDSLISWCKQNEIYVVLDLHAAPGGQGYDAAISDYNPANPSLWQSAENRNKMVALWKRLAEHYAEEDWVAGYDLLNEPNWDLPGNVAMRALYEEVTDSIRTVDPDHIIFIEGNWWANDFTGLTPPWDDNLVYSPHKYWSTNTAETMQWVTTMRNEHNVPLYLGESGENSNVWFRDAIRLLEDLGIGWAWWPLKKVDNISAILSIPKTANYQALLNHWGGSGPAPTTENATAALMELAENLKTGNCAFKEDVVDAMFRQVYSDETRPFQEAQSIPGVVFATDFDLGVVGSAYSDTKTANYHVSTGNYTEWNSGWAYRNDGVDVQPCGDVINCNGYNVGWLASDEWMNYTVNVEVAGVYDVALRVAAGADDGTFHFEVNGADVSQPVSVANSGGWESWTTVEVEDVILYEGQSTLSFYMNQPGFNLSSFEFQYTGMSPADADHEFVSAQTRNNGQIEMTVNKPIEAPLAAVPGGFEISVNGEVRLFNAMALSSENDRMIVFDMDQPLKGTDVIKISYSGSAVQAEDGDLLEAFQLEDVLNTLDIVHEIPGRIEAESYSYQVGVELEGTSDIGGGQNVGYLDAGDILEYQVQVSNSGFYNVDFRTASLDGTGAVLVRLIRENGQVIYVCQSEFEPTGGWQDWATTSATANLDTGMYTMRVQITDAPFNLNWIQFDYQEQEEEEEEEEEEEISYGFAFNNIVTYPNPAADQITIAYGVFLSQDLALSIYDSRGRPVYGKVFEEVSVIEEPLDLSTLSMGLYHVFIQKENG